MKKNVIVDFLIKKMDCNLLSFLSGMVANVPITILFRIDKFGSSLNEHLQFFLIIFSLLLSVVIFCLMLLVTVKKIQLSNILESERGEEAKIIRLEEEKNKLLPFFKITTFCVILFSIVFILVLLIMWINVNFCCIE